MDDIGIDVPLVGKLIALQFPQWADLPIRQVANDGHDNRTFHLGDEMSVRMPSGRRYAEHVGIEHEWLPKIAPHLPLAITEPLGRGTPALGVPWPWSVNRWIIGDTAGVDVIGDLTEFATDLAYFLNALQRIDASDGPPPGQENFFRGGDLTVYDSETRNCIETLGDVIDSEMALSLWKSALNAKADGSSVWVHGDIAVGNLLVRRGRLCAVIDFGQLAAGDPSCDLAIAWTFFSGSSRSAFRVGLSVDDATWARGRGWALWKALITMVKHERIHRIEYKMAERTICEVLSDES